MTKRCRACQTEKPAEEFCRCTRSSDGLGYECKTCRQHANSARADYRRAYHATHRERNKIACATNYAANKTARQRQAREWYAANKTRVKAARERRREAYNLYSREYARRRDARKRANGFERVDYDRIKTRDGMICHICGRRATAKTLSFDHLIPISKGGPHTEDNIAVAHLRCNQRRGAGRLPAQLRLPSKPPAQ